MKYNTEMLINLLLTIMLCEIECEVIDLDLAIQVGMSAEEHGTINLPFIQNYLGDWYKTYSDILDKATKEAERLLEEV